MVGLGNLAGFALQALFLLKKKDKVPNEEALAVAPTVGWLMLAGAVALAVLFIVNAERWRRWWLTMEDPRAIAAFRIVFGFFVICNMNDFFEYFSMLFTDEGIFTADVARQVHASAQFVGFGDGFREDEPWGFFDFWAFLEFLKGPKYSLLYFWDTPGFFWGHMIAFYVVAACFVVGFRTRLMGFLTFFLMNSVFFRCHLFWEGTELVYRVFLAYLICSRCGHAYSVDNWLRCRRLRKQGLLSERDGPGAGAGLAPTDDHPKGLEPVYRLIPAWPRRLMLLQFGALYAVTGILKNGSVWARGEAIYYAWNMDHFYRFYPQRITALFGTNLIKVMTWSTHWGESFLWLIVVGAFIRWGLSENLPAIKGTKKIVTNVCWAVLIAVSAAVIFVTWEVHFAPVRSKWGFVIFWVLLMSALWGIWVWLGRRPPMVKGRTGLWILWGLLVALVDLFLWLLTYPLVSRKLMYTAPIVLKKVGWMSLWTALAVLIPVLVIRFLPGVVAKIRSLPGLRHFITDEWLDQKHVIDRAWLCRWPLGRRVWLTWHIALMGGIFVLMNIGQFQTAMLSLALLHLYGAETGLIVQWVLHRVKLTKHKDPLPAADPTLPHYHRDATRLPQWAMFIALGIFLVGIFVRVEQPEWTWWRWIWVAAIAFLAGVMFWHRSVSKGQRTVAPPRTDPYRFAAPDAEAIENKDPSVPKMPFAYGPIGRFLINGLVIWQIVAVGVWLLPDKDSLGTWRPAARKVFAKWLTVTQTDQGWGMFAPNPPRTNVFLKVLVHDQDGTAHDLKSDVYAPERKPIPWIWNDRMRKMNRRIIGGESGNTQWYRKWYARYICRWWAMEHGNGQEPKRVELVKVWYKIPSPKETFRKGYYVPEDLLEREGAEKVEHTQHCKRTVMGQLPPWLRERHGLPELAPGWKYKPWIKHKRRKWEKKKAKLWGPRFFGGVEAPEDGDNKDDNKDDNKKKKKVDDKKATARTKD